MKPSAGAIRLNGQLNLAGCGYGGHVYQQAEDVNTGVRVTPGVSGPQYVMVPKSMPSSCVSRWLPVN